MKIIDFIEYEKRTKRPLKNLSGCGIIEKGIKMKFKLLFFVFKIKVIKMEFDPNNISFGSEYSYIRVKDKWGNEREYNLIETCCGLKAFNKIKL